VLTAACAWSSSGISLPLPFVLSLSLSLSVALPLARSLSLALAVDLSLALTLSLARALSPRLGEEPPSQGAAASHNVQFRLGLCGLTHFAGELRRFSAPKLTDLYRRTGMST